jgi:Holliday junction resolvase
MSNRTRGDYFERQTRAALVAVGWVTLRAGGSLGAADLVALRADHTPLLVQCKISGRIDPHERAALLAIAERAGARPIVAMRPRPGRVLIGTLVPGAKRLVPIETLRVPPVVAPRAPGVADGLWPPGEQLLIPGAEP